MGRAGLVICVEEPCLACSPDGLVTIPGTPEPLGSVKYKCPYSVAEQQTTPQNAAKTIKTFFCKVSESGNVELKRNHAYYYQVQGSLAITQRLWCDFVVWTPQGFLVERILFDAEQWKTTKPKLLQEGYPPRACESTPRLRPKHKGTDTYTKP